MFTFDSPYERIPTQKRKLPRVTDDMDQLTKDAIAAERKGITYGILMAQRIEKQGMRSLADVRERKRKKDAKKDGNCKWCGMKIPLRSGTYEKYCSVKCRDEALDAEAKNPTGEKRCAVCGKRIGSHSRYCDACGEKAAREYQKAYREKRKREEENEK